MVGNSRNHAADQRKYREDNPKYVTRNRELQKAKRDAMKRLMMRHQAEFYDIYWKICASRDIEPSKEMKPVERDVAESR